MAGTTDIKQIGTISQITFMIASGAVSANCALTIDKSSMDAYNASLSTIAVMPTDGAVYVDSLYATATNVAAEAGVFDDAANSQGTVTQSGSQPANWQNPFADVHSTDWFYNDVAYVNFMNLMNGTGVNAFSPNSPLTRGMVVTVLYRMNGSPSVKGLANPFSDNLGGQYYTDGVVWAANNGTVSGYDNGRYGPNDNITREQMSAILMRYEQFSGEKPTDINAAKQFNDAGKISTYAKDAINNLTMQGIINGKDGNIFDPQGQATRAEFAAILHRFIVAIQ